MKRRRLFTLLSAVSLLLCVAVCLLWVRSYFVTDYWERVEVLDGGGRDISGDDPKVAGALPELTSTVWTAQTLRGAVWLERRRSIDAGDNVAKMLNPDFTPCAWQHESAPCGDDLRRTAWDWDTLGISIRTNERAPEAGFSFTHTFVQLPAWLSASLAAVLPAVWLYRWKRRRRAYQQGLCPACGYDLRASPDRCPQCGAVPVKGAA
jgi:hypothetical protein